MLFSQYNKNTTLMNICAAVWIVYMFSSGGFQLTSLAAISLAAFLAVTFAIRKIKDRRLNLIGAATSILFYSVCVDVLCYYVYPQFVFDQNLLSYIWSGILFNAKYVLFNGLAIAFCMLLEKLASLGQKDFVISRLPA
jgi:hypothetical protein